MHITAPERPSHIILSFENEAATSVKLSHNFPIYTSCFHSHCPINKYEKYISRLIKPFWVMYYLEIQDFLRNSVTIQGVFKTHSQIQELFNTVRTL